MNRVVLACAGLVLTLGVASGCCNRCCGYAGGGGVPQGAYGAPVGTQSAMVMPTTTVAYPAYTAPTTTAMAPLESLPTY